MLQLQRLLAQDQNLDVQPVLKFSRWSRRKKIAELIQKPVQLISPFLRDSGISNSIYHGPDFRLNMSSRRGLKRIVTIHDFVVFNEQFSERKFTEQGQADMRDLLEAGDFDALIVNSHFTHSEALKFFPVWKDRIYVTPLGSDREIGPQLQNQKLPSKYILFFGALELRKNVPNLIRAFEILHQQGCEHFLVLAGVWGHGRALIEKCISESSAKDKIIHLPYVKNTGVEQLYSQASALAFPSFYEGFGIPIVESMRFGTPVVTSDLGALREVAGNAAEFVDPNYPDSIAQGLMKVLSSPERQAELRILGRRQAALFTWEKCAKLTAEVYKTVGRAK